MGIRREPRLDGSVARGRKVEILVEGSPLRAFEGETVSAALLAAGRRGLRTTSRRDARRGLERERGSDMAARVMIELFTKGCATCDGWLAYGHELAGSSKDYKLRVWDAREERDAVGPGRFPV